MSIGQQCAAVVIGMCVEKLRSPDASPDLLLLMARENARQLAPIAVDQLLPN
jgi:hypothetical protein